MQNLSYSDKFTIMSIIFAPYKVRGNEYTSKYKNIPIEVYNKYKEFIDYTAFVARFRGKVNYKDIPLRNGGVYRQYDASVRKVNAKRVDIYEIPLYHVSNKRQNREEYLNGKA